MPSPDTVDEIVALLPGLISRWAAPGFTADDYDAFSMWQLQGTPGPGADPATGDGEIPDSGTVGAMQIPGPVAGQVIKIARASAWGGKGGTLVCADRLYHQSGLDLTVGGSWTQPPLTRPDALGEQVEIWIESYADAANSAGQITLSYTNSAGTAGRTATVDIPANLQAGQMMRARLQAGDTGVRTVQSMTAALDAAGDVGVTLLRQLFDIPLRTESVILDVVQVGFPVVEDEACLFFYVLTGTTSGEMTASLNIVQG